MAKSSWKFGFLVWELVIGFGEQHDIISNGLLTTVDVVGISLFSYPKVNEAQEKNRKKEVAVLSIAQKMS